MEAVGRIVQSAMSAQSDDAYVPPSPFKPEGPENAAYQRLMPEVGVYEWLRLCCEPYDRSTLTLQLPCGNTYKLSVKEAYAFLTALGHSDPDNFVSMTTNFYDAVWYVEADKWHIVTESDRENWFLLSEPTT